MEVLNLMHAAFNQEIHDIRSGMSYANAASGKITYEDGSVAIPTSGENRLDAIVNPILDNGTVLSNQLNGDDFDDAITRFHTSLTSANDLVRCATQKLQRVDNASMETIMTIAESLMNGAQEQFYGIVISDGSKKVNILHPIMATLIATGQIEIGSNISAMIYSNACDGEINYDHVSAYEEQLKRSVAEVMGHIKIPQISLQARGNYIDDVLNFLRDQQGAAISTRERSSNTENVFIPVQLASNGLIIPYYGMIHSSWRDGTYRSENIYPMLSGNVGNTIFTGFGSTCTGDLNSSMFTSLHVLSNMNINSMYFGSTVPNGYKSFVTACQRVSMRLLKSKYEKEA